MDVAGSLKDVVETITFGCGLLQLLADHMGATKVDLVLTMGVGYTAGHHIQSFCSEIISTRQSSIMLPSHPIRYIETHHRHRTMDSPHAHSTRGRSSTRGGPSKRGHGHGFKVGPAHAPRDAYLGKGELAFRSFSIPPTRRNLTVFGRLYLNQPRRSKPT
jgi:hypothetical protein